MNTKVKKQSIDQREKVANLSIYFLVCCIIFILPEMILSINHPTFPMIYARPILCVAIFTINYFFLINRYFYDKNKVWKYVVFNIFIIISALLISTYPIIDRIFINPGNYPHHNQFHKFGPPHGNHYLKLIQCAIGDSVLFALTIGLSIAARLSKKWRQWDSFQKEMIAKQKEMELNNLKEQLNPHFLFNTLNNIYALIEISPEKAKNAIHELSNMLRYSLYDNGANAYSTIDKEVSFINNYIELMRLRLTSNVALNCKFQIMDTDQRIPPLLFFTLVENAFKHGISRLEPSFINITIESSPHSIICNVTNSNHAKKEKIENESGIGLNNLRKRLDIIYPHNAKLNIIATDSEFSATLVINLETN